ncbi:MAG: RHS repeat-associated core domain-containing protein, partial [Clostridiales bacterium]|nr:RHS repeat-associated core domain-containing protein [Clostridiales bacterium]
ISADFSDSSTISSIYTRGTNLIKNNSGTYYTFNGHGDVSQLTNSSGSVTKDYEYDAFGNETDKDDSDTNPWRYCGEYYDSETNDIYLRARYYSPIIGRFTLADSKWNTKNMIYGDDELSSKKINVINSEYQTHFDEKLINTQFTQNVLTKRRETNEFIQNILNLHEESRCPDYNSICQSSNLYNYCNHNPLKFTDTSGENYTEEWVALGSILAFIDGALPIGDSIYIAGIGVCIIIDGILYAKASKQSHKEKADDIPSWAKGKEPKKGESGKDYAKRVMDEQYGEGNYDKGPKSEYNQLKKYGDRGGKKK